jgi:amino acid transporter
MAVHTPASPLSGQNAKGRFGTFAGVFTPNVLTILGLILFLRTGWVVGQAGLMGALFIVLISNVITFLTGLSLSAISTSMTVRTGGNYYMISRSLGLEIGGAIGIPLFLSQAISVAFYVIGFTEALQSISYFQAFDDRLISTAIVLLFGLIAYVGADFALRIQFLVLAALGVALISFFLGGWGGFISPTWTPSYEPTESFWTVFAVFFPAVTGITVGASMSGDLKDPGRSIPRGTILSIVVTGIIYIATVIWLALHATPSELIGNNLIMQEIARWPIAILIGVWAATLSSALGSIMAAPRVLQALALDRVLPRTLGGQLGSKTEPRMAVLVTTIIALSVVWMGDLNFVAPVISMFFLNTYGMTNLAAGIEKWVGNPSYRPRFKVHWSVSLLGALGCYAAMFLINPLATIVAIIISYGIFFLLERRSLTRTWGDVRSGIWFTVARYALLNLESKGWHRKNWRPNILVFTGQPHNREQLVELADWMSRGKGIVTFVQLLIGNVEQMAGSNLRNVARKQIRSYIQKREMMAFAEVDIAPDFYNGALTVAQSHGVGGLEPNAVLMGWSRTPAGRLQHIRIMNGLRTLNKSTLFMHYDPDRGYGKRKQIDVWWGGRGGNADLMLLIAHIVSQHRAWSGSKIRLLRIIDGEEGRVQTMAHMQSVLEEVRVLAEPIVIVREDEGQNTGDILAAWSTNADLSLLGLRIPEHLHDDEYAEQIHQLMERMGSVLLVRSTQDEDILTVE